MKRDRTTAVTSSVLIQDELRSMMEKSGIQRDRRWLPWSALSCLKMRWERFQARPTNQIRKRLSMLGGLAINNLVIQKDLFQGHRGRTLRPLHFASRFEWAGKVTTPAA